MRLKLFENFDQGTDQQLESNSNEINEMLHFFNHEVDNIEVKKYRNFVLKRGKLSNGKDYYIDVPNGKPVISDSFTVKYKIILSNIETLPEWGSVKYNRLKKTNSLPQNPIDMYPEEVQQLVDRIDTRFELDKTKSERLKYAITFYETIETKKTTSPMIDKLKKMLENYRVTIDERGLFDQILLRKKKDSSLKDVYEFIKNQSIQNKWKVSTNNGDAYFGVVAYIEGQYYNPGDDLKYTSSTDEIEKSIKEDKLRILVIKGNRIDQKWLSDQLRHLHIYV